MKTELLSPAKNKEIAFAAIDCGADAVYIGAPNFGARQNASNSLEDIKTVVNYAHKFWVRVCVTVNTILTDEELEDAVTLVKELDMIGVDAVIVQDMGLVKRLADLNLPIEIHMSTQCDNRTVEKAEFFNDIGAKRIVLARELSIEKIREIHKLYPDLEIEFFVHGALCVSYSGQCYLSYYIGGRSANRGECAQPCRKKYTVINESGEVISESYPLCLKDFNASEYLKEMAEAGVYSYKIEGRLKDISYVKNVTAYYRQKLDEFSQKSSSGKSFYSFIPDVNKSFNRGFTSYFLKGRTDCFSPQTPKSRGEFLGNVIKCEKDYILIRTDKEIHSQDGLCFIDNNDLQGFLVNKADGKKIYPNKRIYIKNGTKIFRNTDVEFEKQLSVKRQIGVKIEYKDKKLYLTDEDGIKIQTEITDSEHAKNQEKMRETFVKQFSKTGESDFYIQDINIDSDLPFMPVSQINELRRNLFNKLMEKRVSEYRRNTQKPLKKAKYYQAEVDYRANVYNKTAKEFYENAGCTVKEMCPEYTKPKHQIELMRTKHCIKYALNMCKSPQKLFLKDEKGTIYPLKFDCKNCEMIVLSC